VHDLLYARGLSRFYDLARGDVIPVTSPMGERSHTWLAPLLERAEGSAEARALVLDVQGIHCAACVWLISETFRRRFGSGDIVVNPALGQAQLRLPKGADIEGWILEVEGFGYQFGPARKRSSRESSDLPLRLGICAAVTVNVMLFSVSFYFGLDRNDASVFELFTWLSAALSSIAVGVGGWPFLKAAIRGVRSGLLHLDLPIAVGIVLVYAMSLLQLQQGARGDLTYFDTLNTFITLMLLGRFLTERILQRNRHFLLDDQGAEGIVIRKVIGSRIVADKAPTVRKDDVLLIATGDVVPIDATLLSETGQVSTDWISGESKTQQMRCGERIRAGSFNSSRKAFHVRACTDFGESSLVSLLRQPVLQRGAKADHQLLWNRLARTWVLKVLVVAAGGFIWWLPQGLLGAMNVAASLLVVTCPCAIGIAIPLAYELTQARLRKSGLYVRAADFLDRLLQVRKVVFDKTGTLTLGRLELVNGDALERLSSDERDIAFTLASASSHPVSASFAKALDARGAQYHFTAAVVERPGMGLEWRRSDGCYRLGRASWAVPDSGLSATAFSRDGQLIAALETREAMRPEAAREIAWLRAQGFGVWLLSGDEPGRVERVARSLGIDQAKAAGGLSPEEKAKRVTAIDCKDTLYLGDGVNDSLAFERALVAGTPAIDRPVMPSRSDFFLIGEGLMSLKEALARAAHLRVVVKRILSISFAYNVLAISVAAIGKMSPLVAALAMPASTLALLAFTVSSVRGKDAAIAALESVPTQSSRFGVATS
jgi:Cu2+-exporting ATPase